jgi:hypothetical protein
MNEVPPSQRSTEERRRMRSARVARMPRVRSSRFERASPDACVTRTTETIPRRHDGTKHHEGDKVEG